MSTEHSFGGTFPVFRPSFSACGRPFYYVFCCLIVFQLDARNPRTLSLSLYIYISLSISVFLSFFLSFFLSLSLSLSLSLYLSLSPSLPPLSLSLSLSLSLPPLNSLASGHGCKPSTDPNASCKFMSSPAQAMPRTPLCQSRSSTILASQWLS